jgi:HAD superfamily hydrolase (TIGR01509 family)
VALRGGLVIFDCDGVLVDTEPLSNAMLAEALTSLGITLTVKETRRAFTGLSWPDAVSEIETLTGGPLPAGWLDDLMAREHAAYRRSLESVPGVRAVLELLRNEGRPYCVASSGSIGKMHVTLGATGLLPFVEEVLFSAHMVERGKPFPDLFLHAADRMGHTPEACIVVEDSVPGVTGAVAAGMRVLAYAGDPETDHDALRAAGGEVFASMDELPGLIGL